MGVRNCPKCEKDFEDKGYFYCSECRKRPKISVLTDRERQLCRLVREGRQNKEIAYILHLRIGTVKVYMNRIFTKLHIRSRLDLALWVSSGGLEQQPQCLTSPPSN